MNSFEQKKAYLIIYIKKKLAVVQLFLYFSTLFHIYTKSAQLII